MTGLAWNRLAVVWGIQGLSVGVSTGGRVQGERVRP